MLGRRSHERFSVAPPVEGTLRVFQDVMIHRTHEGDLVALASEAGIVGELLTLDESHGADMETVIVRVVESRPVVMEGAIRHRLRLEPYEVPHS